MRRAGLLWIALGGLGLAAFLAGHTPAQGQGRGFSNRDLNGEYGYNIAHISIDRGGGTPVTKYCESAGTVTFDGIGTVTISETERCNTSGTHTNVSTLSYTVNPDGSLIVFNPLAPSERTHGQILDHAHVLLLDGTAETNPDELIFHGVAVKK